MRKQLYKKGFEVQKWKIIDRTPVNKNHTIFTLASSEYENEKGIFREFIKIRDNVLTNLIKNVENINDVKKRSLHRQPPLRQSAPASLESAAPHRR